MPQIENEEELQPLPEEIRYLVRQFQSEFETLSDDTDAISALVEFGLERQSAEDSPLEYPQVYVLAKLSVSDSVSSPFTTTRTKTHESHHVLELRAT